MSEHGKFIGFAGTYTKAGSEGVYTFTLDTKAKKIVEVKAVAKIENPTYLNASKDNEHLYTVIKEGEKGGVAAFKVDPNTGQLKFVNKQLLDGAPPCYVSVNEDNTLVLSANFHKGSVETYSVNEETGEIEYVASVVEHPHSDLKKGQQGKPHVHYADFTPGEKHVAVVDLGIDKIVTYEVEENKLKEVNSLSTSVGSGPRHLTFHPNDRYAYAMTEFSSEVLFLTYDESKGSFTQQQAVSTIPADFTENNQGSAIHISSDGRFVYAGNRGHNSIATFKVDQDSGQLTFIEWTGTEGDWPRDFVLDPTEQFIVASNQETGNLVLFERDQESGKLTLLQSNVTVPEAVCVKFLHYK
ncbi:6-phosphogluconolactonase [Priestia megaterium]|uniref:lactonase family protein n=1 Tax=Priestia TaxID=2800373 RepID=UPI000BEBA8F2|nr:lactonase family protein [Priestia megaterium]MED3974204.1 lactonase family protein [Priestia megaterium]PEB64398.1 6-phosphogluconolactonase [Priestia megaterium]PEE75625.1 6-phosphogluconolactonase [Priestia megaterium]